MSRNKNSQEEDRIKVFSRFPWGNFHLRVEGGSLFWLICFCFVLVSVRAEEIVFFAVILFCICLVFPLAFFLNRSSLIFFRVYPSQIFTF